MHIGWARCNASAQVIPVMVERTEKIISQAALQMLVEDACDSHHYLIAECAVGGGGTLYRVV